jgi:hypothetical protein
VQRGRHQHERAGGAAATRHPGAAARPRGSPAARQPFAWNAGTIAPFTEPILLLCIIRAAVVLKQFPLVTLDARVTYLAFPASGRKPVTQSFQKGD